MANGIEQWVAGIEQWEANTEIVARIEQQEVDAKVSGCCTLSLSLSPLFCFLFFYEPDLLPVF